MSKRDKRAAEMYALYQTGKSLSEVGECYGVSRQSVYDVFHVRGWRLRSSVKHPHIMFNGDKYTVSKYGYYRKTNGDRSHLHRNIWVHFNGAIPSGYEIHHKNFNKLDNRLENFELLTTAEHASLHNRVPMVLLKRCANCHEFMQLKTYSGHTESPSAYKKRRFCGQACHYAWRKGKPRFTRAA